MSNEKNLIAEWQPIMPTDALKFKVRTIYQFLKEDGSTFLMVGCGTDKPVEGAALTSQDVVAWREFDTRPESSRSVAA